MVDQIEPSNGVAGIARRFTLDGRRALVTGGAMSIGAAIVRVLAEAGADVAIQTCRRVDGEWGLAGAADEVAGTVSGLGRRAAVIDADLADAAAPDAIHAAAVAALGGVDILVACASVQQRAAFEAVTADETRRTFEINFLATQTLIQRALPAMRAQGWGRVLSVGSINQLRPEPQLATYAAMKAAQHNLIANLARTHAAEGVTLNTLSPGLVATQRNLWRRTDAAEWAAIERAANPMRRAGTPDEMAGAALLLCSDAGAFITGIDLQAAGGAQL